jgi:hypothetical protein
LIKIDTIKVGKKPILLVEFYPTREANSIVFREDCGKISPLPYYSGELLLIPPCFTNGEVFATVREMKW